MRKQKETINYISMNQKALELKYRNKKKNETKY